MYLFIINAFENINILTYANIYFIFFFIWQAMEVIQINK